MAIFHKHEPVGWENNTSAHLKSHLVMTNHRAACRQFGRVGSVLYALDKQTRKTYSKEPPANACAKCLERLDSAH